MARDKAAEQKDRIMSEDDKRMARLPKWAQAKISTLLRDIAAYKEEKRQYCSTGGQDTNTYIDNYTDNERYPLPRNSTIVFCTANGDIEITVDRDDQLDIRAVLGRLVLRAVCSNSVHVTAEPF